MAFLHRPHRMIVLEELELEELLLEEEDEEEGCCVHEGHRGYVITHARHTGL
jgi:hypothetical protein